MGDLSVRACERVLSLQWDYDDIRDGISQVHLLHEYFRRAALWSREFKAGPWPFFDVAYAIDPNIRADARLVQRADAHIPNAAEPRMRDACLWSIHFSEVEDQGVPRPDIPAPYEPLMMMFERGISFVIGATGLIDIGMYSVRYPRNEERFLSLTPRAPMDHAKLDEIDRSSMRSEKTD